MNAFGPSLASSVWNTGPEMRLSILSPSCSGLPRHSFTDWRMALTAMGPLPAIFSAISMALAIGSLVT